MAIYQRRQTSVEAFQAPFGFNIKHHDGGYVQVLVGDWVILDERNRIEILNNEDFQARYEIPLSKTIHIRTSPGVNSKTITPEDVDMSREF
jgi:hypothetical protein